MVCGCILAVTAHGGVSVCARVCHRGDTALTAAGLVVWICAIRNSSCLYNHCSRRCCCVVLLLQALTSGGGKSQAFASAIASAVSKGGCGSVGNVLAQAEASAQSSGKGKAFSEALASASAEAAKCAKPRLPLCSTKDLSARNCCSSG